MGTYAFRAHTVAAFLRLLTITWIPKERTMEQSTKIFLDLKTIQLIQVEDSHINPLSPGVKLQILLLYFHTFLTEVVGRSC